ncbi:Bug family tripartite tricarboxylate transporter substrate binding protein [Ramlibacter sp. AW1]|uniref:Bug family tripartite tricarboxylate transporter substrate binding protein n=2 Tax=Ramlibacter aurantiacus TaxID=2801330 RepID=A0A937D5A2_9BURK|nr:Bug family tripartite tricarboxylate transporter substrate binding protein [Ramlibacter aurantiacus]
MAAMGLALTLSVAQAQTAPAAAAPAASSQAVKLLVGFPPGGSTDTLARLLADKLSLVLRQPVVVENKPGAGGRIAAQALKASAPDGLNFMVAPNATPVFQALLYPVDVLKFDVLKDFASVGVIASYPFALAVGQQTGATQVKDYVAWLKANPRQASFGTAGAGGQTHFTGIQFGRAIGVDMQAVPYRGNGPLITDLLGGQVPAGVMTAGDILPQARSGRVRVLGVFGGKRSPLMPEVPTLKEQGIDIDAGDAWTGMWAPAATPREHIERMQNALRYVVGLPEVREAMQRAALQPDFQPAAEMDALLRKELAYWGPVIKASGFKPEQ